MSSQHLSDEAVAACADGVLTGTARDRATRHAAECAECARAVRGQREAVLALRAAPPPALPSGLLDRLRAVPETTPIRDAPSAIAPDGPARFATSGPVGPMTMTTVALRPAAGLVPPAALVPAATLAPAAAGRRIRRFGPVVLTATAVAAAGVFAAASSAGYVSSRPDPHNPIQARLAPAADVVGSDGSAAVQPHSLVSYHRP